MTIRQRLIRGLVSLSIATAALVALPSVASATTNDYGPSTSGGGNPGTHLFGAYRVQTTTLGYILGFCISPGIASPTNSSYANWVWTPVDSGFGFSSAGEEAAVGWLAEAYGESGLYGIPAPYLDSAISSYAYASAGANMDTYDKNLVSANGAYSWVKDFATSHPGPWTMSVESPAGPYFYNTSYTGIVHITDANHQGVPLVNIDNQSGLSGFSWTNQQMTDSGGSAQFTWTPPAGGTFTGSFSTNMALPGATPVLGRAPAPGPQDVLLAASNNRAGSSASTPAMTVISATIGMTTPTLATPLNGETISVGAKVVTGSLPSNYNINIYDNGALLGSCAAGGWGVGGTCTKTVSRTDGATHTFTAVATGYANINSTNPSSSSATWGTGTISAVATNTCVTTGGLSLTYTPIAAANLGSDGSITITSSGIKATDGSSVIQTATFGARYSGIINIMSGGSVASTAYVNYSGGASTISGWVESALGVYTYSAQATFGSSVSPGSTPAGTPTTPSLTWSSCSAKGTNAFPT